MIKWTRGRWLEFALILGAFALAMVMTRSKGFESDVNNMVAWALRLYSDPWSKFYAESHFAEFFPAYLYVLTGMGWVIETFSLLGTGLLSLVVKFPSILALMATALLVQYNAPQWNQRPDVGRLDLLMATALWALNPGLLHNAAVFGQVDVIFVLLTVLSFHFSLRGQFFLAAVFVALNCGFKPLGVLPLVGVLALAWTRRSTWTAPRIAGVVAVFTTILLLLFWPFWQDGFGNILPYYYEQFASYRYATLNALNFYAVLGWNWVELKSIAAFGITKGAFAFSFLGLALVSLFAYATIVGRMRFKTLSDEQILLLNLAVAFVFYLFAPGMHERYFVMVMPFFAFVFLRSRALLLAFVLASVSLMIDQMAAIDAMFVTKRSIVGVSPLVLSSFFAKGCAFLIVCWRMRVIADPSKFNSASTLVPSVDALNQEFSVKSILEYIDETRAKLCEPFRLRGSDYACLIVLLVISLGFGFYKLGAEDTPMIPLTASGRWIVELPSETSALNWNLFDGRGKGSAQITCAQYSDLSDMKNVPNEKPLELNSFYKWRHGKFTQACTKVRLDIRLESDGEVSEVFFQNADLEVLVPNQLCNLDDNVCIPAIQHPLFDEQNFAKRSLGYYESTYFDEIYYIRAAKELLQGERLFENTHPPLGKVIMGLTIKLVGDGPFGWRFSGALIGALIPLILFFFARALFGQRPYAYIAGVLGSLDMFRVSMSRIATIDIPVSFFLLCAYLFAFMFFSKRLKDQNNLPLGTHYWPLALMAGLFWGLAMSTKWVAVYAAPAFAVCIALDFFVSWVRPGGRNRSVLIRQVGLYAICFSLIPLFIYFSSYLPLMLTGSMKASFAEIIKNQGDMFRFHSSIVGAHPFSSRFYEWPIIQRPLLMFQSGTMPPGHRSLLVALGNPVLWWSIPIALLTALFSRNLRKDFSVLFVILAFACQMLPWLLVQRSTFIYHFLPSSLMGLILIACLLVQSWPRYKKSISAYAVALVAATLWFLPLALGFEVRAGWIESLKWFSSWSF